MFTREEHRTMTTNTDHQDAHGVQLYRISDVLDGLHAKGIQARVDHTGGGCLTVFAGPEENDIHGDPRSAAVAGPFSFVDDIPTGDFVECCTGPDDDGESDPIYFHDAGCRTVADVVDLIALQVAANAEPVDGDTLDAHGFDGTGRGFARREV
jgi:hypothetical protein